MGSFSAFILPPPSLRSVLRASLCHLRRSRCVPPPPAASRSFIPLSLGAAPEHYVFLEISSPSGAAAVPSGAKYREERFRERRKEKRRKSRRREGSMRIRLLHRGSLRRQERETNIIKMEEERAARGACFTERSHEI